MKSTEIQEKLALIPQECEENTDTYKKEPANLNDYITNFHLAIKRHQYLKENKDFLNQYHNARVYITLKILQHNNDLPDIMKKELAKKIGVSEGTLINWLNNKYEAKLIRIIRVHEVHRQRYQKKLSPSTRGHRIDPSTVYSVFFHLKEHPKRDHPEIISSAIANLYQKIKWEFSIHYAELRPYAPTGPQWLRAIAKNILRNLNQIEYLLNQQLRSFVESHIMVRIGVVNDTLFIRRHDTNPQKWINLFGQENFYFLTPETKNHLLRTSQQILNVNDLDFSRLIRQITHHPSAPTSSQSYLYDRELQHNLLKGETLHLVLDITKQTIHDVQTLISHIGTGSNKRGRLQNPKFPPLEPLRTQLLAIMYSDGHLSWQKRLHYGEGDIDRVEYVKSLFKRFGSIQFYENKHENGITELQYPKVIGQLFEQWGMPIGDRSIQNIGLPQSIVQGNQEIKITYLRELIPEDGSFDCGDKLRGRFRWARAVVIDAGPKNKMYGLTSKLTVEDRAFIQRHGVEKKNHFQPDFTFTHFQLSWKKLQALRGSKLLKVKKVAERLIKVIERNPSQLLNDETQLCESLGISIRLYPIAIHLWPSERVTFVTEASTKNVESALKWAHLAPPNDRKKRAKVEEWLNTRKIEGLST